MTPIVQQSDIDAAAGRISGHVHVTPVIELSVPGVRLPVSLKLENTQAMGSFKVRGAFNTLLASDVPESGVVAASGGNHGAAVAYAARSLGYPAAIFVPELAGASKIALIRDTGADLTVVPGAYSDALDAAQAHEAKTGAMQIHAYDAPLTVAGQGTLLREWEVQGLAADTVLIAVGGGGLIGGAMAWNAGRRKIVGIEPERAATLANALVHGPEFETQVGGIAANALGAKKIGRICHDLAVSTGLECLQVPDEAIEAAQRWLWKTARQYVEPAGAAALSAVMSGAYRPEPDERVAVLVCGANPAPGPFD